MKTPAEKLQFVHDAIVERVPEILELKVGCKVINCFGKESTILSHCLTLKTKRDSYLLLTKSTARVFAANTIKKILGCDITIEHVLLALKKANKTGWALKLPRLIMSHQGEVWNLKKDNLLLQSEATIAFLYDIFSK